MKFFILMFTLFIFCGASSCTKGGVTPTNSTSLIGKWQWVQSTGGIGGFTLTPKTEGITMRQEFSADSTFKFFRADTLEISGKFITRKDYLYGDQKINLLKIDDRIEESYMVRNDTLYTWDITYADGFNATYVRIK